MSDIKLGTLPTELGLRDAVHVPIVVCKAATPLYPGHHVNIDAQGNAYRTSNHDNPNAVGIVDPFLSGGVKVGELVYICLRPGNIQSLRHYWTHPAVPELNVTTEMSKSEQWLRVYAAKMNPYDSLDEAYDRLIEGLKCKELFAYGSDLHCLDELDDADELRYHAERVLGIRINFEEFEFHCSC